MAIDEDPHDSVICPFCRVQFPLGKDRTEIECPECKEKIEEFN
jgi:DNA-directed RNA polymerase subunit RPC12/RpoP